MPASPAELHNAGLGYGKAWAWASTVRVCTFEQFLLMRNAGLIRRDAEMDKFDQAQAAGIEMEHYAIVPVETVHTDRSKLPWPRRQLARLDEWLATRFARLTPTADTTGVTRRG